VFSGLALLSSLAGNLLLTGSLTNVLIAERADRVGRDSLSPNKCPRRGPDHDLIARLCRVLAALTRTLPVLPQG
jgi:hypothetical protein